MKTFRSFDRDVAHRPRLSPLGSSSGVVIFRFKPFHHPVMHLFASVSIALAVSASALPRSLVSRLDLRQSYGDNSTNRNPQTSPCKCSISCRTSSCLQHPFQVLTRQSPPPVSKAMDSRVTITNGRPITCNPAPQGVLAASINMPFVKVHSSHKL
jgi:hypothetical protein